MATSTTKGTVKANEKRELEFYLKKGSSKKKIKPSKVKWSTGNAKVATVKKGIMTTKKEGKVTITAKYQGHTVLYKITVKGDARFDVTSEAVKGIFKNEAESITENGAQIFRASMTESGTTLVADYNVSKNQLRGDGSDTGHARRECDGCGCGDDVLRDLHAKPPIPRAAC